MTHHSASLGRRLWIMNHYADAPDRPAGTRHYDLARGLVDHGWEVWIFAAGFSHVSRREERLASFQLYRIEQVDRVRFVWVRTVAYRGNSWRRLANMLSYAVVAAVVQLRVPRPDAIIGSTVHPLAALLGYGLARLHGARFFFEIRDLWPQTLIDLGALRPGVVARSLWATEGLLVRNATGVITLLPGVRDYLASRDLPVRNVHYIPNGVRLEPLAEQVNLPPSVELRLRALRADGATILGYLGAHGRVNRLDVVIRAAHLVSDSSRIHVLLIGDGPEKTALQALAREIGARNVDFMQPISKRQVPRLLTELDGAIVHATATPVYRYGISFNKLFDYMAAGKPVIFACRTAFDPVHESGAGLTVEPDDPERLAGAYRAFAALPVAERQRMGDRGRRFVGRHHDSEVLAERLNRVLTATP